MSDFRIVCTKQEPPRPQIGHIVLVGTGTTRDRFDRTWTVAQVYAAMDLGHRFFTYGERSRRWARVEKFLWRGRRTLRSAADATDDNNLDNLPVCNC